MKRFFNSFYARTGIITDAGQRGVVSRVSAIVVQGTIAFSLLGTIGVDMTPLITAAGVTGATLGFACKDWGANFAASLALSGQPTLRTGNKVTVGTGLAAISGTVVDWDTRYIYLRNDKQCVVSVPNSLLLTSVVVWENPAGDIYTAATSTTAAATSSPFSGKAGALNDKEWKAASSGGEQPKDGPK